MIREANVADAPAIKTLVESLSHYYLNEEVGDNQDILLPLWFANTLTTSQFESRLSSSDFANFVYVEQGQVVGYLSIKEKHHLYHLFVAQAHQRKGLSKKLWNHALSVVGYHDYTVRSSLYAVPIYRQFGFKESGPAASKEGIGFQPMAFSI